MPFVDLNYQDERIRKDVLNCVEKVLDSGHCIPGAAKGNDSENCICYSRCSQRLIVLSEEMMQNTVSSYHLQRYFLYSC